MKKQSQMQNEGNLKIELDIKDDKINQMQKIIDNMSK